MNLFSLAKAFPTEEHALAYWMKTRWPKGVRCIACDHPKCYLIETKGKTGKPVRLFECADCSLHFSATTGTLFHGSHVPLQKWFMAIGLMVEAKKGISANQIARHIGVTYKTAWYLCHRIRQAMQEESGFKVGGPTSTVEIDEMFVGGRSHLYGRKAKRNQFENKKIVVGLAERDGQLHMEIMDHVTLAAMRVKVAERLEPDTQKVITDGKTLYRGVFPKAKHTYGIHSEELRDRTWTSTYTVESAFSLFKRGIVGNNHRLSDEHLNRYLGEFCWRYNRRKRQPWMFDAALANLAHKTPMPYQVLIGRDKD